MRCFSVLLTTCAVLNTAMIISLEQQMMHEQLPILVKGIEAHLSGCRQCIQQIVHDHPGVLHQFDLFAQTLRYIYVSGQGLVHRDVHRILDSVVFSAEKHCDQVRKDFSRTPYIIHPIGVANHLMMIGHVYDSDIIIAALLHDTVEDTQTTFEEIEQRFGSRVAGFVREVTDDKSLPQHIRKQMQIEHAFEKSAGAAQIKLGDKLDNLIDLTKALPIGWKQGRVDAYFRWAQTVVDRLPWVNASLKQAIDEVIENYWQSRGSNSC